MNDPIAIGILSFIIGIKDDIIMTMVGKLGLLPSGSSQAIYNNANIPPGMTFCGGELVLDISMIKS